MSQHAFSLAAAIIFALVSLAHFVRMAFGASFVVYDLSIPMWASGIAVVVAGYLAYEGFRLAQKSGYVA